MFSTEKAIAWPCILATCIFHTILSAYAAEKKGLFDLTGLKVADISNEAKELLKEKGFVVTP